MVRNLLTPLRAPGGYGGGEPAAIWRASFLLLVRHLHIMIEVLSISLDFFAPMNALHSGLIKWMNLLNNYKNMDTLSWIFNNTSQNQK
ncbi:hypothetical protein NQ315_008937 [Exocentrus adspersus]|uniref:Uncharacterized protein n=1 Tax=Exocentrus adspersus TaxID=1586481 RepID=A0AAV8V618_9CUCU|nr:hypothetical protein NQ315_008937 [Exocentrus adspersus]